MAPLKFCFVVFCVWSMSFVSEVQSSVNVSTTECKDVKKGEIVVDACVKIEKVAVAGQGKDYGNVESSCKVNGSRLVTLKSKVKWESFVDVMKKNYGCDNKECRFWIGLTWDGMRWKWSDHTFLDHMETPMPAKTVIEECAVMNFDQTGAHNFSQPCAFLMASTHVICEWSLSDSASSSSSPQTTKTTAVATTKTTKTTAAIKTNTTTAVTKNTTAATTKTTNATSTIGSTSITISSPKKIPLIVWIFIGINAYCIPSNIVLGIYAYVLWKRRQRNKKAASANADVETGKGGKTSKRVAGV